MDTNHIQSPGKSIQSSHSSSVRSPRKKASSSGVGWGSPARQVRSPGKENLDTSKVALKSAHPDAKRKLSFADNVIRGVQVPDVKKRRIETIQTFDFLSLPIDLQKYILDFVLGDARCLDFKSLKNFRLTSARCRELVFNKFFNIELPLRLELCPKTVQVRGKGFVDVRSNVSFMLNDEGFCIYDVVSGKKLSVGIDFGRDELDFLVDDLARLSGNRFTAFGQEGFVVVEYARDAGKDLSLKVVARFIHSEVHRETSNMFEVSNRAWVSKEVLGEGEIDTFDLLLFRGSDEEVVPLLDESEEALQVESFGKRELLATVMQNLEGDQVVYKMKRFVFNEDGHPVISSENILPLRVDGVDAGYPCDMCVMQDLCIVLMTGGILYFYDLHQAGDLKGFISLRKVRDKLGFNALHPVDSQYLMVTGEKKHCLLNLNHLSEESFTVFGDTEDLRYLGAIPHRLRKKAFQGMHSITFSKVLCFIKNTDNRFLGGEKLLFVDPENGARVDGPAVEYLGELPPAVSGIKRLPGGTAILVDAENNVVGLYDLKAGSQIDAGKVLPVLDTYRQNRRAFAEEVGIPYGSE